MSCLGCMSWYYNKKKKIWVEDMLIKEGYKDFKDKQIEVYGLAYFVKFLDYFKQKNNVNNVLFRFRDFIKPDAGPVDYFRGNRHFTDIDLSYGKIRLAFAYGLRYGLIERVSKDVRRFDMKRLVVEGWV